MKFLKQASWFTVGNIITLFFQWLIIMVIPKITDFSEAGVFAVAISVSSIMNQISTFTLYQYQVSDRYSRFSENTYGMTRLITIAISFLCIIPVVLIFGYGVQQILIIIAYTLYRNIINYAYLHLSQMQIIDRLDYVGKAMIIEGLVSFSVFIGTYVWLNDLLIASTLMAVLGGGTFLLLMSIGYKASMGRSHSIHIEYNKDITLLLAIGFPLLISTLSPTVITALPKLLLENYWGTEVVGFFSTLTAPTIVVPTVITSMFIPLIVYFTDVCRKGDMSLLRRRYTMVVALILAGAVMGYVVCELFAPFLFGLIYGGEIVQYTYHFSILTVGIFIYSIGMCGITTLITKDQGISAGVGSLLSLPVSIVIFLILIPEYGMDGATWGLLASYSAFAIIVSLFVYLKPLKTIIS